MQRRPSPLAALACGLLALVAILSTGSPAGAHSGEESYIYLYLFDERVEGSLELVSDDLAEVLDIDLPDDPLAAEATVEANLDLIEGYAAERFSIGLEESEWAYDFGDFFIRDTSSGNYVVLPFEVDREFSSAPRQFVVEYDAIFDEKPERNALLIIGTDWRSGTFANENNELLIFNDGDTRQLVDLDSDSWWSGFAAVVELGAEHIQIGYDHILFIISLVLPSVLVFGSDRWRPAESFGSSLWRVLKIVTMFTVAHSITLSLGGLGIIELSPTLVEGVIALSIALAALHNLRPVFANQEWLLAFGFGLFHGFGFAGLLSDLGLDRTDRFSTLLGFNLGVELGQALIVLLLFPILFVVRRTPYYEIAMKAASIALAVVATGWAIERFFDTELGVDRIVTPLFLWPRVLVFVAIGAVVALAYWRYEASRGRLIPLERDQADDVEEPVGSPS